MKAFAFFYVLVVGILLGFVAAIFYIVSTTPTPECPTVPPQAMYALQATATSSMYVLPKEYTKTPTEVPHMTATPLPFTPTAVPPTLTPPPTYPPRPTLTPLPTDTPIPPTDKPKCNKGEGNGGEGCDPGNNPDRGNDDEEP